MSEQGRVGLVGKAWISGVVAYAVIRGLILWSTIGEYGVNPWVFVVIDVGTAWPYAYGQLRVVHEARLKNWRGTQRWSLVALAAFAAPYVYIVGAGSGQLPPVAWVVIGLLVTSLGVASVVRTVRQIRRPSISEDPQR